MIYRFDNKNEVYETSFIEIQDYKIIGMVSVQCKNMRAAFIRGLYVHENFRRQGIASKLMEECLSIAKIEVCETAALTIHPRNFEAIALYKKLGFFFAYKFEDGQELMCKRLEN